MRGKVSDWPPIMDIEMEMGEPTPELVKYILTPMREDRYPGKRLVAFGTPTEYPPFLLHLYGKDDMDLTNYWDWEEE